MSAIAAFTKRSLRRSRARTVVSIIGIALSCALIVAVFTSVASIREGLLVRTMETEGSWQVYVPNSPAEALDAFQESAVVADAVTSCEIGSALLTERDSIGAFVTVRTLPSVLKGSFEEDGHALTVLPELASGRLPETADEVVLPTYVQGAVLGEGVADAGARSNGTLAVGSQIELDLGTRVMEGPGGNVVLDSSAYYQGDASAASGGLAWDGSVSSGGGGADEVGSAAAAAAATGERLVDAAPRTFTVVGFYETQQNFLGNNFTAAAQSVIALTAADAQGAAVGDVITSTWLTTQGLASLAALQEAVGAMAGSSAEAYYHTNLTRYQGLADGSALFDTLTVFAGLLTVVIIGASVVLVGNAFSISVAERTRQFGLLRSIGASKRQLRRAVAFEAVVLGAIGIPLGVLAGLGGTALVFRASADAFSAVFGTSAGVPFAPNAPTVLAAALLSLITLSASAWVPARRAARVSAIDAIRQTRDVRPSRRERRTEQRGRTARTAAPFAAGRGVWGRLCGVPGVLAHRNLSRSSARGRSVVVSLAMSVVLVAMTGSVSLYLDPVADHAASGVGAAAGAPDVVVTARAADSNEDLSDLEAELASFLAAAQEADGAQFAGSFKQGQVEAVIPAGILSAEGVAVLNDQDELAQSDAPWLQPSVNADGDFRGAATVFYLDDASWRALVDDLGLDEGAYTDPAAPRAIALNRYIGVMADARYVDVQPFAATGQLTLYYGIDQREGWTELGLRDGEDGDLCVGYLSQNATEEELSGELDASWFEEVPVREVAQQQTIEIGALADEAPAIVNTGAATSMAPVLLLPDSVVQAATDGAANGEAEAAGSGTAATSEAAETSGADSATSAGDETAHGASWSFAGPGAAEEPFAYFWANLAFEADDHVAAAEALSDLAQSFESSIRFGVQDIAAQNAQMRMAAQAVRLFIVCFSVVTLLIAVANVFNMLTNSIILRTREFAVLQSVGMGARAFARMLVCECASYAVRGLAIGLVAACALNVLFYQAAHLSFALLPFQIPWASLGCAVLTVCAVLAASVAFALHRSRGSNVVEALRAE